MRYHGQTHTYLEWWGDSLDSIFLKNSYFGSIHSEKACCSEAHMVDNLRNDTNVAKQTHTRISIYTLKSFKVNRWFDVVTGGRLGAQQTTLRGRFGLLVAARDLQRSAT